MDPVNLADHLSCRYADSMRSSSADIVASTSSGSSAIRGRITCYCVAEALDRKTLTKIVKSKYVTEVRELCTALCQWARDELLPPFFCRAFTCTLTSCMYG